MKVGDLVRRVNGEYTIAPKIGCNSLAIIVGFDFDGDLLLRYANPTKDYENMVDVDYKSCWRLADESR